MTIIRPRGAQLAGAVAGNAAGPDRGPIKRIVVGSFGTGALLLVLLTVGNAAGAREHVITALALIGAAAPRRHFVQLERPTPEAL